MSFFLYNNRTRIFIVISGTEYLIREPENWTDVSFELRRTEHHGFEFKFPASDVDLKFHNRKTNGTSYQKAKDLIDAAIQTSGADADIKLRFEYYENGSWNSFDEIELIDYVRNENDSSMKSNGSLFEQQIANLLQTKVSIYEDQDYEGNQIDRLAPESIWFHSKALVYTLESDWVKQESGEFLTVYGTESLDGGSYINLGPLNITKNDFGLIASESYVWKDIETFLIAPYDGSYLFDITLKTQDGFIFPELGYSNPDSAKIIINNADEYELTKTSSTDIFNVASSTYVYNDSILIKKGDKISIVFESASLDRFFFQKYSIDTNQVATAQSFINITAETTINGAGIDSYSLIDVLRKSVQILTGSGSLSSDFFDSTYDNLYITSGSILKGADPSRLTAPIINLESAFKSIDAIFNTGWSIERDDIEVSILVAPFVLGSTISGTMMGGQGVIQSLNDNGKVRCSVLSHFVIDDITNNVNNAVATIEDVKYYLPIAGIFSSGTTITGLISGATATIISQNYGLVQYGSPTGIFVYGEPVRSNTSITVYASGAPYQLLTLKKYQAGDSIIGDTTGAIGTVVSVSADLPQLGYYIYVDASGFSGSETVSGDAKADILSISDFLGNIRLEESEYFYNQNEQIIDISDRDIYNVKERIASEYIYNEAEFGYPDLRYDELNTIDEFNTKAEYLLASRKVKNKYSKLSDWKAQGYDIEFLRRQSLKTDSTAFKEDKDVYIVTTGIFQRSGIADFNSTTNTIRFRQLFGATDSDMVNMIKKGQNFTLTVSVGNTANNGVYTFEISNLDESSGAVVVNESIAATASTQFILVTNNIRATESDEDFSVLTNLISPETSFNAKLSPARMKMRHDVWLNASQHYKSPSDKVINTFYDYNGEMVSQLFAADNYYDPDRASVTQAQDWRLTSSNRFKHWVIPYISEFTTRLSFDEFNLIRQACQSTYGYITHKAWSGDIIDAWILEVTGKPTTNEFTFKTLWFRINGESPIPPQDFWEDQDGNNILQSAGGNTIQWT